MGLEEDVRGLEEDVRVRLRDHRSGGGSRGDGARSWVAASRLDAVALVLLILEFRSLCSAASVDPSVLRDDRILPGSSGRR